VASARPARLIAALAVALLAGYMVVWAHVSAMDIGRSDFTSTYVGATLLREGHRGDLYSDPLQAQLHGTLIAPDREGNLPFVDAPVAALLAAPVTLLSLDTAYRLWGLLQMALLVAAVVVAVRSAPWPSTTPAAWKIAAGVAGLAGTGTFALLVQAQWTSVSALGLALAYREWRQDRLGRGAALLVLSAGVAKPHLALALVAFMLGWRSRRLIAGALAGALGMGALSFALVGPAGVQGFLQALTSSATRWDLDTFVSFIGLPGVLFGNSGAAQALGIAGSVLSCALAFWLGALVRRERTRLEPALAGVVILSLLAAPHALLHDLALLAPVLPWSVAFALRQNTAGPAWSVREVTRRLTATFGCWALVTMAALVTVGGGALAVAHGGALAPGATVAPALVLCAGVAAVVTERAARSRTAVHVPAHPELAGVS
jgi:hypothetical protein